LQNIIRKIVPLQVMAVDNNAKFDSIVEQELKVNEKKPKDDEDEQSSEDEEVILPSEVPENVIAVETDGSIKVSRVSKLQFLSEIESRSRVVGQVDPNYGVAVYKEKSEQERDDDLGSKFQLIKKADAYDTNPKIQE
jgi:hypothetical protein